MGIEKRGHLESITLKNEMVTVNMNRRANMKDDKDPEIDVLDSNYPLMLKLKNSNGTYGHSKNVASLMESCGAGLGLDVYDMKMAGFLHDMGKTNNPTYFIENQTEETGNPHDKLPPHISYKIIAAHVGETANILINDPNVPRHIIQWCTQHHGTTLMKAIYEKSEHKNEDSYRYKGEKPECLEAGILMVCDQLEAKCRAMYQSGVLTDIEAEVDKTFDHVTLEDEQWDNISLTFKDIRLLKEILCAELKSMYKPKRIDYPEQSKNGSGEDSSGSGNAEE